MTSLMQVMDGLALLARLSELPRLTRTGRGDAAGAAGERDFYDFFLIDGREERKIQQYKRPAVSDWGEHILARCELREDTVVSWRGRGARFEASP